MASYRSAQVDGRTVLIPNDPLPGHINPPLAALNQAYRADDDERRDEHATAAKAAGQAVGHALSGIVRRRGDRPEQKPLRPRG